MSYTPNTEIKFLQAGIAHKVRVLISLSCFVFISYINFSVQLVLVLFGRFHE